MAEFPRDWQVDTIGSLVEIETGSKNTQDKEDGGDYPFYVRSDTVERINCYTHDTEGVVTAGDGVGTGKVFHFVKGKFALHQRCYLMHQFKPVLDPQYFYWFFKTYFYDRITSMTAKSSVDSVRREMIAGMQIAYPDIPEQRRIADALDSVDKLIDNLSRRIEKKRQVKQGVMQELLTGKKRLPGFKGEWTEKSLSAIATMYSGGTPSSSESSYYGGGIPWVSIRDITAAGKYLGETEKHLTQLGLDSCPAKKFPVESILFAMYASIGKCCIAHASVASSQAILGIYDLRGVDLEYLYQVLAFREREFAAMGQTGTQANLSKQIVERIRVLVPSLSEQCAIAAVLSDMDAEIAKLEAKRDKYIDIKQGMMNDLLTGKVRI